MTDKIVTIAITDDVWTDENPRPTPSALMASSGTDNAYLSHSSADWSGVTHTVVGEWDEADGSPLGPIDAAYSDWIRPMGNADGVATGVLDSMRWQGHPEPKWYAFEQPDPEEPPTVARRYPLTNMPFSLEIERQYITDDGFPHTPYGWKVTMISDDPARDITARGIGIYSDPECTQYLFTTGAFLDDGTGTFYTECPVGQRTADEQPIYFALLLGSAQEGIWNLEVGQQEDIRQFWSGDM